MTAAAKNLHVSQPTLTVAMKNLEEHLGTQLFLRQRDGVRLTSTGEELLRHAREVFAVLKQAEVRVKALESEDVGTFVLGCHESLGAYFLPDFMSRFLREHPNVELLISNEPSAKVQESVVERRTHFGIVVNPHPHPDLVIVNLFHDAMMVMVADDAPPPSRSIPPDPDFALDPSFVLARHRLVAGPLIYAGRVGQCQTLCDLLAAKNLLSERSLVCGDLELVKSLALAGIGPALLPRRVAAYGHEGKLVPLHPKLPSFPDTICLVYRSDLHRTRAAMRTKDALVAYGQKLDYPSEAGTG